MGTTGTFGTGAVAIESGAFVDFNRSNTYVCANVISGAGKVRNLGAGPVILTGANTYTGGTDLVAGTLGFSSGGLGSSGSITFTAGATLRWYSGNTQDVQSRLVFANGGSGNGIEIDSGTVTFSTAFANALLLIVKKGAGRLTIASTGNVVDEIAVEGGELKIGTGGSIGTWDGAITIEAGATVVFDHSNDVVITQQISGAGQLIKRGSGKLTLSNGGNDWTGATTVEAGHLALNITGSTDVTVESGATFSTYQTGETITIGELNIEAGGILLIAVDSAGPLRDRINCDTVYLETGALFTLDGYDEPIAPGNTGTVITCSASSGEFSNHLFMSVINTGNVLPDAPYILMNYNLSWTSLDLDWYV